MESVANNPPLPFSRNLHNPCLFLKTTCPSVREAVLLWVCINGKIDRVLEDSGGERKEERERLELVFLLTVVQELATSKKNNDSVLVC